MNYTIGEVSKKTGIKAHTIRYYEEEGILNNIKRKENGVRLYETTDIEWIILVACLRRTNMPLNKIKEITKLVKEKENNIEKKIDIYTNHREQILKQLDDLKGIINELDRKIDKLKIKK